MTWWAVLKEGPVKELPILSPGKTEIQDPRDGKTYLAYQINIGALTEDHWAAILEDMRSRFPDAPAKVQELRERAEDQGGIPIREERVDHIWGDSQAVAMLTPDFDEDDERYDDDEEDEDGEEWA